jgi:hypothetical protein
MQSDIENTGIHTPQSGQWTGGFTDTVMDDIGEPEVTSAHRPARTAASKLGKRQRDEEAAVEVGFVCATNSEGHVLPACIPV